MGEYTMFWQPKALIWYTTTGGDWTTSVIQGQDAILVEAPIAQMWPLIADSRELGHWGPPVRGVTVLTDDGQEGEGTWRRVDAEFAGKPGHFLERRIEHIEGRKMAVLIEEETFGLFRLLSEVGSSLELLPVDANHTQVIFTFFHNTKGIAGSLMNQLVILRQQRRNRLAALASLKRYAERQRNTSNP